MHTHPLSKVGLISAAALFPVGSQAALFNLNDVTPGGMDPFALQAFQDAVAIWQGIISDNIEVNLDIRFDGNNFDGSPMGATTLGSAARSFITPTYTAVRGALVGEATPSSLDTTAIANLQAGPFLTFETNNHTTSAVFTDNNNSRNNEFLDVNTANAKALGLFPAAHPVTDGFIAFNTAFSWDFDQSDGVGGGLQDFVGVTVHEIGHVLGFRSGVDEVDRGHGAGPNAPEDQNGLENVTVLDLFRYSAAGQMDMATGGAPYFSIDGGTTNLALFSTGRHNGDGQQGSHWKDNLGIGLFDPTANPPGQINVLSQLDIDAIDVIGYDLVPEPSSTLLVLIALGFTTGRRKR